MTVATAKGLVFVGPIEATKHPFALPAALTQAPAIGSGDNPASPRDAKSVAGGKAAVHRRSAEHSNRSARSRLPVSVATHNRNAGHGGKLPQPHPDASEAGIRRRIQRAHHHDGASPAPAPIVAPIHEPDPSEFWPQPELFGDDEDAAADGWVDAPATCATGCCGGLLHWCGRHPSQKAAFAAAFGKRRAASALNQVRSATTPHTDADGGKARDAATPTSDKRPTAEDAAAAPHPREESPRDDGDDDEGGILFELPLDVEVKLGSSRYAGCPCTTQVRAL